MKARALYNNAILGGNDGGFSLVELLIALTILAIGLLAIAHMQILSIQGSAAARRFNTATNIVQREIEEMKGPGPMLSYLAPPPQNTIEYLKSMPVLYNVNADNDDDDDFFSPSVGVDTDIDSEIIYDTMKVYDRFDTESPKCGPLAFPDTCAHSAMDYVVYINVRNLPASTDNIDDESMNGSTFVKDVKVYVLWQDDGMTHHVSVRTLLGRDDNDIW